MGPTKGLSIEIDCSMVGKVNMKVEKDSKINFRIRKALIAFGILEK